MSAELLTLIAAAQTRADTLSARLDAMEARLGLPPIDDEWLSQAKVCGVLDISANTLLKLPIKRHVLIPNKVVRYLKSEVLAYLKTTRE